MDERAKSDTSSEIAQRQKMSIKSVALEMAIKAGAGNAYNDEGKLISDPVLIVKAAEIFETFIKG